MEENKNMQNFAELNDELLEQTSGGYEQQAVGGYQNLPGDFRRSVKLLKCSGCGRFYSFSINDVPEEFSCENCGTTIKRGY